MEYAFDVLEGKIIAGRWVRRAVERHLEDLEDGHARGLYFDEEAAWRAIDFFSLLRHSKGEWAGERFELTPPQHFIVWCLFGWKRADGTRRFHYAYIEVARKFGKSTLFAGIGLYLFYGDGEPGAEVYTAATKLKQARIIHGESIRMVRKSPGLSKRIGIVYDNLHHEASGSKYEPLGRVANESTFSEDGLNVHGALIDELHAHKSREMFDVLETGTGARRNWLIAMITTAGYDQETICWDQHRYICQILDPADPVTDDNYFGFIASIDEDDDWEDPRCWVKANPNMPYGMPKLSDLEAKAQKAKNIPTALNNFLRRHLNVWTQQHTVWMPPKLWMRCADQFDWRKLRGRECYGGLDLGSVDDLTSFCLTFPDERDLQKPWPLLCWNWIPEENVTRRVSEDRVPYDVWIQQGFILTTPGNAIDFLFICRFIEELWELFAIRQIARDRWGAIGGVDSILGGMGFQLVDFGQGFRSMSPAFKGLMHAILTKRVIHGGNPVLTWAARNVAVKMDPAGNIKPDKEASREKIDPIVAAAMSFDLASRNMAELME